MADRLGTDTALSRVTVRNNVTVTGRADAPVLLFANGFGCDKDMWRRVMPSFVEDYRVVLFDHVGAGRSDPASYDRDKYATVDGYAGDLLEICDAMDLQEVTVVAHSVGAMMAIVAAAKRPERFSRLVLLAPSPCYLDHPDEGYVGGFCTEDIDDLLASMNTNHFAWAAAMAPMVMGPGSPELTAELADSFCRTNPDTARDFARVTFLTDTRHLLSQVRTPVLLLQCSDDLLAPVEVGAYLRDQLAESTLVQLRATGHCPHVSAPQETAAAILGFLRPS